MRSILSFVIISMVSWSLESAPVDLAVRGEGYLVLSSPSGGYLYAKHGRFAISGDGEFIAMDSKFPLLAYGVNSDGKVASSLSSIIPIDEFSIAEDGQVMSPMNGKAEMIAKIPLAIFGSDEDMLIPVGDRVYMLDPRMDQPSIVFSGAENSGRVVVGKFFSNLESLSLRLDGRGYFILARESGSHFYSKSLELVVDAEGVLATQEGHRLLSFPVFGGSVYSVPMAVGFDMGHDLRYLIQADGNIYASYDEGRNYELFTVIPVATFVGEDFLKRVGKHYLLETKASGYPSVSVPGGIGRSSVLVK